MDRKIICIIPARGGSKRLPRKNVIDFLGKPIIAYTIEAALQADVFERIVVSTEDVEIAEVALRFGAQVSERSVSLATDASTVVEVCSDLLERERKDGSIYDVLCCLYATAPLRTAEDIRETVRLVQPGICNFSMAVTEYFYPPHQAMKIVDSGYLEPMWPDIAEKQSQSMPRLLIDNGSTYAAAVPEFYSQRTFRGKKLKGYIMPRNRSIDIDEVEDLELALYYARGRRN